MLSWLGCWPLGRGRQSEMAVKGHLPCPSLAVAHYVAPFPLLLVADLAGSLAGSRGGGYDGFVIDSL